MNHAEMARETLGHATEKDAQCFACKCSDCVNVAALLDRAVKQTVSDITGNKTGAWLPEAAKAALLINARLEEAKWWQIATNCTQTEARIMNERIADLESNQKVSGVTNSAKEKR